ncbi:flagellar assembly protein FliH [Siccibacter turicensis]|uniref:Flagellar assembly protein FliH n=1 Tax=Siccibacter turicensis TaxID=357233 RepID=A0A2P8VK82_9ENTR|nr:flagellar assembly protein FliH [Siccibacter turicensis]PSN07870.1 flagellar assembly protein FliH [Siccibacter turicensis]
MAETEKLRGRYRLHRFPPRHATSTPVVTGLSSGELQRKLMEGYQDGLEKGYREGVQEGQDDGYREGQQKGYADGMRDGYAEGSLAGQREGLAAFTEAAQPLDALCDKVNDFTAHLARKQRDDLLQLVEKVTRQVIRCELALQPTQLLALVEEAVNALPAVPESLHVLMNQDEFQRIQTAAPQKVNEWGLAPSPDLGPGECRIVTDTSELDIGCEHRLQQCMEKLTGSLNDE